MSDEYYLTEINFGEICFGEIYFGKIEEGFAMEKFIGRERELAVLQKKYNRDGFGMAIVYGRRRIGKTMLINEFIDSQNCKSIRFTSVEQNEKALLSMMKDVVLEAIAPEMAHMVDFPDFDKLFDFIGRCSAEERIVFFIDEYPYLVNQCPYIQSLLQKHIDTDWKKSNLFFIICGSLVGFMKDEVLAESAPLYGRSDLELHLHPFRYDETALFLEGYSNEEKAIVYGLTGGVAKYVRQFNPNRTLDENIIENFYSFGGYFSEELIQTVITNDRKNPALYNSIIDAVASGHTKYNEIASYCGVADVDYQLKILTKAEILEKRVAKKPYYVLNDSMLEFWFRYVNRATSMIQSGSGEKYYYTLVKSKLHEFMGKVFEKMAKEYLIMKAGSIGIPLITEITDYQTTVLDGDGKQNQIEIDLLGKRNNDIVLIGECKFRNEIFDKKEFDDFMQKIRFFNNSSPMICLFSLSGFSEYVKENSKDVFLIDIDRMYEKA